MADHPVSEPEEWRPVPGHPGYEASSLGRVRSLDRWITCGNNTTEWRHFHPGIILKLGPRAKYLRVGFGKGGNKHVHVVICETFHGPRPSADHHAAHWNGVNSDNRATNLRWATRIENKADELRHGTRAQGSRHGRTRLTEADITAIRSLRSEAMLSFRAIGKRFGIGSSSAKRIVDREVWDHLPKPD